MRHLGFAILGLLLACGVAAEPQADPLRVDRAQFLLSDAPEPPADDAAGWQVVSLPDRWAERRPAAGGLAWYRLEVAGAPPSADAFAVFLPRVNMNAAVWVNGSRIGSGGRFDDPVSRNFNRPLYFTFPAALLGRDRNVIHVRHFAYARSLGELGTVYVGSDAALRPAYESSFRLRISAAQLSSAFCIVTTLLAVALWLGSRGAPVYGTFALVTGSWTLVSVNYWLRDIPVSAWVWEPAAQAAMDFFMLSLAFWAHRYAALDRPRVDAAVATLAVVDGVVLAVAPRDHFFPISDALHATMLPAAVYGTAIVLRHAVRTRPLEALVYVPAGIAALAFGAHDLLIQFGVRPPGAPYLLPYIVPLLIVAFGTTMIFHFSAALREAEDARRLLERRVADARQELERSYAAQNRLERERLVADERERLVREMHDGLGGQLVSVLSLAEAGRDPDPRVAEGIRAALDDMRLVINSLDPGLRTLSGALGAARARFEPALARSGVALEWQAGDLPATPRLGPQEYLHVLRIVQEALANVIRHAGASRAVVRSGAASRAGRPGVSIEVIDDGRGLPPDEVAQRDSRGLRHIRERAARLSGALDVGPADAASGRGTRVSLWLPIDAAPGHSGRDA